MTSSTAPDPIRRGLLVAAAACLAAPARAQAPPPPTPLTPRPARLRLRPPPADEVSALTFSGGAEPLILRAQPGQALAFDLAGPDRQPLSLHWMGARIDNAADGAPPLAGPVAAPGKTAAIRFVPPEPGFVWAKPSGPAAAAQLRQGLLAGLIVEERAPPPVDLDLIAVIQDWATLPTGQATGSDGALLGADDRGAHDPWGAGFIGDVVTINGAAAPLSVAAPPRARVRLRLLNACPSRLLVASFSAARVHVIAIDGQPCDPFEPVRRTVPIGPGARFELILDLPDRPGEAGAVLRGATPPQLPPSPDQPLVAIRVEGSPSPERPPFEGLPPNPSLPLGVRLQDARRADLVLSGGHAASEEMGQAQAMGYRGGAKDRRVGAVEPRWRLEPPAAAGKPLFSVKRGAPIVLGFVNRTSYPQTMHVRGHVMRLLHNLDDGWEPYWRDAVITPAGKTSRVAFLAENPGRWLIENADPERAAAGLSAWFEVS